MSKVRTASGELLAEQQTDHGVEFVDLAKAVDAQAVLGDPVAIAGPVVPASPVRV